MPTKQPDNEHTAQSLLADIHAVANQRDRDAFSRLYDHFSPRIRSFSLKAMPGANLVADEIVQEVMIKLWQKAATYNPNTAALSTWIFSMARNARIDYQRKHGRHLSDIDPETIFSDLEDESADPFLSAQAKNSQQVIQQGLKALPSDQTQVLAKIYLEGKSHQEASEELGLPLGTVKSRVRLALQRLSVLIKK
ncbi:MAG: sigma-70 family RNA polymerase sigma factor [Reinekea sp.]|jgi:RNA polymerase sigma factor (sigma-70 family)